MIDRLPSSEIEIDSCERFQCCEDKKIERLMSTNVITNCQEINRGQQVSI